MADAKARRRNDPLARLTRVHAGDASEQTVATPVAQTGAARLPVHQVCVVSRGEDIPGTRYRLVEWRGEGALGVVYEAHHIDIERRVALKILRPEVANPTVAKAFKDEARAISKIGSPHIVEIYDLGELEDGRVWFAMELLEGHSLADELGDPIDPGRAIGILRQVCKGLAAAHQAGIVHRDVKPENIMLLDRAQRPDTVKVVDFGISSLVEDPASQGAATGTPYYMAPEQIMRQAYDGRLDVYAIGCVAYELLSGALPFEAETIDELLHHHCYSQPVSLSAHGVEVPPALEQVIMHCLAKEPDQRYYSMIELEAALCEAQVASGLTTPWDDLPLPEVDPERKDALRKAMPDPMRATAERPRWMLPVVLGAAAAMAGGVALFLALRPPQADGHIEGLVGEARDAASRARFVYPDSDKPDAPTAYTKVRELEGISGDDAAHKAAEGLRAEFAGSLVSLGDRFWEDRMTRPMAYDYYASALLFEPDHDVAAARAPLTPGEMIAFREKAENKTFAKGELLASAHLAAMAQEDQAERDRMLKDLEDKIGSRGLQGDQSVLCMREPGGKGGTKIASAGGKKKSGSAAGAKRGAGAATKTAPDGSIVAGAADAADPGADAAADGDSVAAGAAPGSGRGSSGRSKPRAKADPKGAKRLAKKGTAALHGGRTSDAERLFHQALALHNRNAEALGGLSELHFNRDNFQKAASYGRKAVSAAPKRARYRILLGDAYYKMYRYPDAREQYAHADALGHPSAKNRLNKVKNRVGG